MRAPWGWMIAATLSAHAATLHVAADGSAEFRTVSSAVKTAKPGDTVLVHDGTYGHEASVTGGDSANYSASPVVLRRSGTPSAWITIKAKNKARAILDCEMQCDAYIDLVNSSYIVIQDFVIRRGYKEGIHSNDAAHHITLRGNVIENIANRFSASSYGLDGLYTNPACHDFVIEGNVFRDIGRTGGPPQLDHGLYLRGSNFTVTNNVFYGIRSGWPIQLADGLNNILVANNTFALTGSPRDGHIMLWKRQTNVTIRNNIFYQPRGQGIVRHDSSIGGTCEINGNLTVGADLMEHGQDCAVRNNLSRSRLDFVNASEPPYDFHLRTAAEGSRSLGAYVLESGR